MGAVEASTCCAPLAAPALADDEARATADVFGALAEPARVKIVNLLATSDEPVCVCNLVDPLGLTQPTVSHHLKQLVEAGLLRREKRGTNAHYALVPGALDAVAGVLTTDG